MKEELIPLKVTDFQKLEIYTIENRFDYYVNFIESLINDHRDNDLIYIGFQLGKIKSDLKRDYFEWKNYCEEIKNQNGK